MLTSTVCYTGAGTRLQSTAKCTRGWAGTAMEEPAAAKTATDAATAANYTWSKNAR